MLQMGICKVSLPEDSPLLTCTQFSVRLLGVETTYVFKSVSGRCSEVTSGHPVPVDGETGDLQSLLLQSVLREATRTPTHAHAHVCGINIDRGTVMPEEMPKSSSDGTRQTAEEILPNHTITERVLCAVLSASWIATDPTNETSISLRLRVVGCVFRRLMFESPFFLIKCLFTFFVHFSVVSWSYFYY